LEIASRKANDVLENNDVVLSPRLISAARIQPKNELIVETVMEEDEDDEDDDDEEPNIMDSTETRDVAAIPRGDPHSQIMPENLAKRWHIGLDGKANDESDYAARRRKSSAPSTTLLPHSHATPLISETTWNILC
jgi:hypothetical protein